jgi:hypothetical protein
MMKKRKIAVGTIRIGVFWGYRLLLLKQHKDIKRKRNVETVKPPPTFIL